MVFGDTPSEWSDIGGAAVLHRSLPDASKELLSYMKIPDEAKKRKFLTVREMLSIKKKLTKACRQLRRDSTPQATPVTVSASRSLLPFWLG